MELNKKAFALASGVIWGALIFLSTIWVVLRGGGEHLSLLNQFYIGYTPTYPGSLIGLVYGFVDGFIVGYILAALYNALSKPKERKEAPTPPSETP